MCYCYCLALALTGNKVEGQIYIPAVNWLLAVLTVACLLIFRSNTAIGNGFGKPYSNTTQSNVLPTAYQLWHAPLCYC